MNGSQSNYQNRRSLEQSRPEEIRILQLDKLNRLLEQILPENAFYRKKLPGIQLPLKSLEELADLPLTTKLELVPDQPGQPSRNITYPRDRYVRFHRTSGTHGHPLVVLDTDDDWNWWIDAWQFVLDAASVDSSDVAFMAFSFGPFIGFWSANDALAARDVLVIPGGGLGTLARLHLLLEQKASILCCTPSYALHLANVAKDNGIPIKDSNVSKVIVAGEPGGSVPAIWQRIEEAWGASVIDHAGATEIGPWGYAAPNHEGLFVNDSQFIAEFLPLHDANQVSDGDACELVLTNLGRVGAPLLRYRTGDLVRPLRATDETNRKIQFTLLRGGVLGRVDDMMIVRGVNVYPSAVEQILREFSEIEEYRMTVTKAGEMDALSIEVESSSRVAAAVADTLNLRLGLHVDVATVDAGTLPRFELKGKRFIDQR